MRANLGLRNVNCGLHSRETGMRGDCGLRRSNLGLHSGNQEAIANETGLQLRNSDCERREASSDECEVVVSKFAFRISLFAIRNRMTRNSKSDVPSLPVEFPALPFKIRDSKSDIPSLSLPFAVSAFRFAFRNKRFAIGAYHV